MSSRRTVTAGARGVRRLFAWLAARDSWERRALALVAILTTIRLVVIAATGISDTEAYYVGWAHWPSLSYYDHPPLVAWTTWLVSRLDGSTFAVRFVPVACAGAFGLLVYRFAARLFSPRAAFVALAIVTALPAFLMTSVLVNPEGLLAPLWLLMLGALYDLRDRDERWRPLALGALVGVGFLAKYTALLVVPLALGWLATSRETRRWLRRPSLYAGALLALVLATPVIVWNAVRGFPSVELHFVERAARPSLAVYEENALHALRGQFGLFHPLVFPAFLAVAVVACVRARRDGRYRFLAWMGIPTLTFFFVMMVRVKDAEPHWTMVGYVPLAMAMGALVDEAFDRGAVRAWLVAALGSSAAALALFFAHMVTPAVIGLVPDSIYDPNADPYNETLGWHRIDAAIVRQAEALGPRAVVVSDHNVLCGHIEVSLADAPPVYCASPRRTEFDFVGRGSPPRAAPVVYVDTARYERDPALALPGRACRVADRVDIVRGGHLIQRVRVWSCPPSPEQTTPDVRQALR